MPTDTPAQWTILVYMAAADDLELEAHAIRDLREMQRGMKAATQRAGVTAPPVRLLAQIDRTWPPRPQRVEITADGVRLDDGNGADENMGSRQGLTSFLDWGRRTAPAAQYFLVLWGHAYGLGFGRDHGDPLTLIELRQALELFSEARGHRPLDLLGANACAMGYVEAAFELRKVVARLVASQVAVPFAGWPYEAILREITARTTPDELGRLVIDRYVSHFEASPDGDQVSMAMLDPGQADGLRISINDLATAVDRALNAQDTRVDLFGHVRAAFLATTAGDVRPLIDLADLCHKLQDMCLDLAFIESYVPGQSAGRFTDGEELPRLVWLQALWNAAGRVLERLAPWAGDADEDASSETEEDDRDDASSSAGAGFVLYHQRHDDLDGLHGVGIFAPFVTDEGDLDRLGLATRTRVQGQMPPHQTAYRDLAFVTKGTWEPLVFDRLKAELPAGMVSGIEATGATSRGDRSAVAQMMVSIDSSFTTLERRLEATRIRTMVAIGPPAGSGGMPPPKPLPPQALGAFGALRLMPLPELKAMQEPDTKDTQPAPRSSVAISVGTDPRVAATVSALKGAERMIGRLERAVRSTVTNAAFGLGPGVAGALGKRDLGKRDLGKRDLGKRDLGKRDLGKRDLGKRDLGKRDLGAAFGNPFAEPTAEAIVAGLFGEVSEALQGVERAATDFELAVAESLAGGEPLSGLSAHDRTSQAQARARRALRLLGEATTDARRTLRRVLGDPVYGFGPGPEGLSAEDRRALARASGMNGETLMLL